MIESVPAMAGGKVAWGKPVWGVTSAVPTRELKEGESACCICFNAPEEIRFSPCKHVVCQPCLDRLRQANIFKADAGIKCPFCRQFVEEYLPISEGANTGNPALIEANRAARAAAVARLPIAIKKQATLQDVQAPPAHQDWECTKCYNINFSTRSKCNKCGQAGPRGYAPGPAASSNVRKDVMKCSDVEMRDSALEKMHPNFQQALQEAGTPALPVGSQPGTVGGSPDSIIAAMSKRGQDRLHHIIRVLSDHGHLKELTTAFYGNYTVQDLLDATHKMRQAAAKLRARNSASSKDIERMLGFSDGQDSLGRLARGIVAAMPEAATHKQGFYVVAKLLDVGEPADMLPLAGKVFPGGPQLTADLHSTDSWRGIKVMVSLVDAMSELALQGSHMSAAAMGLLDSLCGVYLKDEHQLDRLATHRNCGQMLVDAAFAGLPRPRSKQMLTYLANHARQFLEYRWGLNTMIALLSLTAADEECKDIVVTHVCIIAQALEGSFANTAVKLWGQPNSASGADLVWRMLQRLDEEGEHSWVKSIVHELFKGLELIQANTKAMELLADALCLQGIPDPAVASHAQMLKNVLGDAKAMEMLKKVKKHRGAAVSQPPPPNTAHKDDVQQGPETPAPLQFGSMQGNGGDYSSVFASPPRNLPAVTAPAAPAPSVLGPPIAPPAPPPPPPPLAPPTPGPIPNGIPQSGPLLPIPPPSQATYGPRPPPLQRLMVSPRGQGYNPGPPPGVRLPAPRQPAASVGVPAPLAHLMPHLMVTMPPAVAPPAMLPANLPTLPPAASSVPQPSGHHRVPQAGPTAAQATCPAARLPVIPPSQAPRGAPGQRNGRPAQNNALLPGVPPAPAANTARGGQQHPAAMPLAQPPAGRPAAANLNGPCSGSSHEHPVTANKSWACQVCTYKHEGAQAEFLACAICGTPIPAMPPDS